MKKGQSHAAKTREKIRTSMLINRLEKHIFNGEEMSTTQVKAVEILLKKTLPDLKQTELSTDPENPIQHEHSVIFKGVK